MTVLPSTDNLPPYWWKTILVFFTFRYTPVGGGIVVVLFVELRFACFVVKTRLWGEVYRVS